MKIIESLVRLRDDLKQWVTVNLLFLDKRTQSINDDGSGALNVIDSEGNIILRVDEDGVKTTAVDAKAIRVNGEDVGTSMENIEDDESAELTVTDPNGNIIAKVDETGLETTELRAKKLLLNGVELGTQESVSDYNDLENAPDIEDDGSAELVIADPDGNVVMRVNGEGIDAVGLKVNGAELENLGGESDVFVATYGETTYDEIKAASDAGKAVFCIRDNVVFPFGGIITADTGVSNAFFCRTTITPGASVFACNSGAGWIDLGEFELEYVSRKVTALSEESTDTQYPSAKAVYDAISNIETGGASMENINDDESGELTVQDANGNPIMRVDEFGLETTRVVAGGVDLGAAVAALGESEVFLAVYDETTYDEIKAASDAGKAVFCVYDSVVFQLGTYLGVGGYTVAEFYCIAADTSANFGVRGLWCVSGSDNWTATTTFLLERSDNKVTELTANSTDDQYPSAKAVYTALSDKQDNITGTAGQFVVIGDDGKVTTKTIGNAEEATFGA